MNDLGDHEVPVAAWRASAPRHKMLVAVLAILAVLLSVLFFLAGDLETCGTAPTDINSSMISEASKEHMAHEHEHDVRYVNFTQNALPYDLSTSSDQLWDDLVPPHHGFISQRDEDGQKRVYGIAMFHQLHCLHMLRDLLRALEEGTESVGKEGIPLPNKQRHAHHCFDYLVQSISCAADGTLEPTLQNTDPTQNLVVNGYNIIHECRDPQQLWDLATRKSS